MRDNSTLSPPGWMFRCIAKPLKLHPTRWLNCGQKQACSHPSPASWCSDKQVEALARGLDYALSGLKGAFLMLGKTKSHQGLRHVTCYNAQSLSHVMRVAGDSVMRDLFVLAACTLLARRSQPPTWGMHKPHFGLHGVWNISTTRSLLQFVWFRGGVQMYEDQQVVAIRTAAAVLVGAGAHYTDERNSTLRSDLLDLGLMIGMNSRSSSKIRPQLAMAGSSCTNHTCVTSTRGR